MDKKIDEKLDINKNFNGSDFHHHYLRKNKSQLNNIHYNYKKIIHFMQQKAYRNEKWSHLKREWIPINLPKKN